MPLWVLQVFVQPHLLPALAQDVSLTGLAQITASAVADGTPRATAVHPRGRYAPISKTRLSSSHFDTNKANQFARTSIRPTVSLGVGAAGEMISVAQAFQPSGRLSAAKLLVAFEIEVALTHCREGRCSRNS